MLLGLGGDKFVMDFSGLSCLKTAEADRAKHIIKSSCRPGIVYIGRHIERRGTHGVGLQ